jgi:hypothetical protein
VFPDEGKLQECVASRGRNGEREGGRERRKEGRKEKKEKKCSLNKIRKESGMKEKQQTGTCLSKCNRLLAIEGLLRFLNTFGIGR